MSYQDDFKQHLLVHLQELLVPLVNIGGFSSRIRIIVCRSRRISAMMRAPFDDFVQDSLVHLRRALMSIPSIYLSRQEALTLSKGMASFSASGTSIRICFSSMERSATWRSMSSPLSASHF